MSHYLTVDDLTIATSFVYLNALASSPGFHTLRLTHVRQSGGTGLCKSWTLDSGLDHGLDYGLDYGLNNE